MAECFFECAASVSVDDDVGLCDELPQDGCSCGLLPLECDAAKSGVEGAEHGGHFRFWVWAYGADVSEVVALVGFDFEDLGAHAAQEVGGEGSGDVGAEEEDFGGEEHFGNLGNCWEEGGGRRDEG